MSHRTAARWLGVTLAEWVAYFNGKADLPEPHLPSSYLSANSDYIHRSASPA